MSEDILTGRIVVIDDDEMINKVLTLILKEEFVVESYSNAEDALASSDFHKIDVVLTDVNLPGMTGIDLINKIHEIDSNVPVVVITGMSYIDIAISALKSGAVDFIQKPFYNDQLLLSVRKAQDRKRLVLENVMLVNALKEKNSELEKLNEHIQNRNQQIENDLEIASNLQNCLFPASFPEIKDFSFHLKFKPVEKISGDFFDVIEYDDDTFALVFADVSGHGVPAALYSAMVKTAITSQNRGVLPPSEMISGINRFLISVQKKMSYNYATICFIIFDKKRKKITYSNAGIPAPILVRSNGEMINMAANGPFVGIFEDAVYTDVEFDLLPSDKIFLFTDGAFEFYGNYDMVEGYKVVFDTISSIKDKSVEDTVERLYNDASTKCESFEDDITIMGIKYL